MVQCCMNAMPDRLACKLLLGIDRYLKTETVLLTDEVPTCPDLRRRCGLSKCFCYRSLPVLLHANGFVQNCMIRAIQKDLTIVVSMFCVSHRRLGQAWDRHDRANAWDGYLNKRKTGPKSFK